MTEIMIRIQLSALLFIRFSTGYQNLNCRNNLRRTFAALSTDSPSQMSLKTMLAAVQMTSTNDRVKNLQDTIRLVEVAANQGALFISLPECSSFIGGGVVKDIADKNCPADAATAAEEIDGPYTTALCALAARLNVWLSVGGFPEKHHNCESDKGIAVAGSENASSVVKVYNTHFIISPAGELIVKYRKIHLFDSPFSGLMESKSTVAGRSLAVADCGFARVGLTTCYDLRFPELYGALCRPLDSDFSNSITDNDSSDSSISRFSATGLGAEIVLVPSAFTVATGIAHWEVLLRARAIENQCYVVAAAQIGAHNEKRSSYGRTIIIDPWGTIIAHCPSMESIIKDGNDERDGYITVEGVGSICFAPFDREMLLKTREKMPVQMHRRPDIYYKPDDNEI